MEYKIYMEHKILVIGGTGKTGSRVAKNLSLLGNEVRIAGRKTTPAFDWENPDTYDAVLKGMDRAYIVYYPDLAMPGSKDAIRTLTDKALKAGLDKVVLLSGKGEKEAEDCEQIVGESGLNYTIVRASWFNQNFSEGAFLEFILNGEIALPMPDAEIPFVDANDIADVVAKVILDDSYNGKTVTVTGPRKMTYKEAVEIMSAKIGKVIHYQPISLEEFKDGMKEAGLPDSYIWLFSYLFEEVLGNPENQVVSDDVQQILGREATDFSDYVANTLKTGVWNQ